MTPEKFNLYVSEQRDIFMVGVDAINLYKALFEALARFDTVTIVRTQP